MYIIEFSNLPYFWRYFVEASNFSACNFLKYCVKFFLCKLSKFDVKMVINFLFYFRYHL